MVNKNPLTNINSFFCKAVPTDTFKHIAPISFHSSVDFSISHIPWYFHLLHLTECMRVCILCVWLWLWLTLRNDSGFHLFWLLTFIKNHFYEIFPVLLPLLRHQNLSYQQFIFLSFPFIFALIDFLINKWSCISMSIS